jgi:glycosyltransferase involved in cell wall biosynthesis
MKLTIITINRDNKDGLESTIQSVINQSFLEWEFIIIDGASTDGSVELIEKYALEEKIDYWVSEPDKGVYSAMNKGVKKASGEYCLFLNSGDCLVNSEVLENAFNLDFTEDLVYGSIIMSNGTRFEYSNEKEISFRYFLTCTLPHSCTFIKTTLFQMIGDYDENLKIVSDWEFFLVAVCKYNVQIRKIPIVITLFDINGISSISSNKELILKEKELVLNRSFPRFLEDYKRLDEIEKRLTWFKKNPLFRVILKMVKYYNKLHINNSDYLID